MFQAILNLQILDGRHDFTYSTALPLNMGVSIKTFDLDSTQRALKYA